MFKRESPYSVLVTSMVSITKIIDELNTALGMEIAAIVQYSHNSYSIMGPWRKALTEELESFAKDEMEHMEYVSKKIVALGGVPTTKPAPIYTPAKWREMLEADLKAENEAIERYKTIAALAEELGDVDLKTSIENIASEEYGHKEAIEKFLKEPM
jgi:bacterioferritin